MRSPMQSGTARLARSWPHLVLAFALTAAGCHHHHTNTVAQQTPPPELAPLPRNERPPVEYEPPPPRPARIPPTPVPEHGVSFEDVDFIATHSPILTEERHMATLVHRSL